MPKQIRKTKLKIASTNYIIGITNFSFILKEYRNILPSITYCIQCELASYLKSYLDFKYGVHTFRISEPVAISFDTTRH